MLSLLLLALSFSYSSSSLETIQFTASLSTLVYKTGFSAITHAHGGKIVPGFAKEEKDRYNPKYCLYEKDNNLYLIIRGTVQPEEWIGNFDFVEYYDPVLKARFHGNFYTCAVNILNQCKDKLLNSGSKHIIVTGHSRAGGICSIINAMLYYEFGKTMNPANKMETVVFGAAPSMQEIGIAAKSASLITTVVHRHDIVPRAAAKSVLAPMVGAMAALCHTSKNNSIHEAEFLELSTPETTDINLFCEAWRQLNKNVNMSEIVKKELTVGNIVAGQLYWLTYDRENLIHAIPKPCLAKIEQNKSVFYDHDKLRPLSTVSMFTDHIPELYVDYLNQVKNKCP